MQNVTGSLINKPTRPKLTPFEQADYNAAKFVLNAQLSEELNSILKRLDALERMKKRLGKLLENTESVTVTVSTKSRLAEIEEEIIATEFLLQAVCSAYTQSQEM